MKFALIAVGICISQAFVNSPAVAKDVKKQPTIVAGRYKVANCTRQAGKHYGPDGKVITVKVTGNKIVFEGLIDRASGKTAEFHIKGGKYESAGGNLLVSKVVKEDGKLTIKCLAAFTGNFDLLKMPKKKPEKKKS